MSIDNHNILPNEDDNSYPLNERLSSLNDALYNDDDTIFETEAAAGLAQISSNNINPIINKLNTDLQKSLKKRKKKIRGIPSQQSIYITIITVLLLAIVAYLVIKKLN